MLKSLDFLSTQYDELQIKVNQLESERKDYKKYVQTLEDRIDSLEFNNRATSIELRNLPKQQSETKEALQSYIKCIGKELSIDVESRDIKNIFRVNTKATSTAKPAGTSPIIVEFSSNTTKDKIINSLKKYRKNKKQLTTDIVKLPGPSTPIYISENLTAKMKRLYYLSREYARSNTYLYCWTSHGNIYLRKTENSPAIRVKSEDDLKHIQLS